MLINMEKQDRFTKEVCEELRISYSTLYRIRKKLNLFSQVRRCKSLYTQKEVEMIRDEIRKENSCRIL